MTIQTSVYSVDWESSPRIITIASSTVEGHAQHLYDTLMYLQSLAVNMDNSPIVNCSGKEVLYGAVTVGITVELLNAKYKFADRESLTGCYMTGGNVVALDADKFSTYPVEPSINVFADRDLSANATIVTVSSGSGLSIEQDATLTRIEKSIKNKKSIIKTGDVWQLIIYDNNETSPIITKDLKDINGNNISDLTAGVLAQEFASSV